MIGVVPGARRTDGLAEREAMTELLGVMCGLAEGESASRCGRAWCGYFDESQGRCGLLAMDVPGRLGLEATRWFVAHRTTKQLAETPDADEILGARACSL